MPTRRKRPDFRPNRTINRLARRSGSCATSCVVQMMTNNRGGLIQDSAAFLTFFQEIWDHRNIDPQSVWDELDARLKLSAELRKSGIRPRKNGRYRTTKLP